MILYVHEQLRLSSELHQSLSASFELRPLSQLEMMEVGSQLALVGPLEAEKAVLLRHLLPQIVVLSDEQDDERAESHLEWGCADYLFLASSHRYITAKMRNLVRRWGRDLIGRQVDRIDQALVSRLTTKERLLLATFIESGEEGSTRLTLTQSCWGHSEIHGKTLDTHLFNLRRKLQPLGYRIRFRSGTWVLDSSI